MKFLLLVFVPFLRGAGGVIMNDQDKNEDCFMYDGPSAVVDFSRLVGYDRS